MQGKSQGILCQAVDLELGRVGDSPRRVAGPVPGPHGITTMGEPGKGLCVPGLYPWNYDSVLCHLLMSNITSSSVRELMEHPHFPRKKQHRTPVLLCLLVAELIPEVKWSRSCGHLPCMWTLLQEFRDIYSPCPGRGEGLF